MKLLWLLLLLPRSTFSSSWTAPSRWRIVTAAGTRSCTGGSTGSCCRGIVVGIAVVVGGGGVPSIASPVAAAAGVGMSGVACSIIVIVGVGIPSPARWPRHAIGLPYRYFVLSCPVLCVCGSFQRFQWGTVDPLHKKGGDPLLARLIVVVVVPSTMYNVSFPPRPVIIGN